MLYKEHPRVAKWPKATVCKTVYRWFESTPWDHARRFKIGVSSVDFRILRFADSNGDSNPCGRICTSEKALSANLSYTSHSAREAAEEGPVLNGGQQCSRSRKHKTKSGAAIWCGTC